MELSPVEEARLRTALHIIGDEAGGTADSAAKSTTGRVFGADNGPQHARSPEDPRRPSRRTLFVAACAAAVVIVGTLGILRVIDDPSDPQSGSTSGSQTAPEQLACAVAVVEGDVRAIRRVPEQSRLRVTLRVTDWIKPSDGPATTRLSVLDTGGQGLRDQLRLGTHVLLIVPERADFETEVYSGSNIRSMRKYVDHYLPRSQHIECPSRWKNTPP